MTPSVRAWFAARADSYVVLLAALGFSLPLAAAALAHHLEGVALLSPAAVYAGLVIIGFYGLVLLGLSTALFVLTGFSRRLTAAAGGALFFCVQAYLITNSVVYRTYRFHVDAFWVRYVFSSYSGIGVPPQVVALLVVVLFALAAFEWWVMRLAGRLAIRRKLALATVLAIVASFVVGQLMHVVGYYRSDSRITSITPQLPFYAPMVSQRDAARYDEALTMGLGPEDPQQATSNASLRYPLREVHCPMGGPRPNILLLLLESWRYDMMDSTITPNTWALSHRSSVFLNHLSSGNSTPSGVFGLFYGIHPTYWSAVKANNAVIDNPVLIDVLGQNHYAFGIYANSQFGRHKIKDSMFRGITVHENFAGSTRDAKDDDMTNQLIGFIDQQHRAGRPFFGFAFYKSTHYSYQYPSSAARFQPTKELNVALDQYATDVTPFLNDYRNSIYYTDSLIGRVVDHLEAAQLMDETIVIITSDHGEEFNDDHAGWWGHAGNFTRYQVQVPLVFYLPGSRPRRVTEMTAHMDVPTTLLAEVFGCGSLSDYSNGVDLFDLPGAPRPFEVGGYINHAFIMGDDVHVVYPMFVQSYKLGDIKAKAGPPRADLARRLLEETHRFYQSGARPAAAAPQRASASPERPAH